MSLKHTSNLFAKDKVEYLYNPENNKLHDEDLNRKLWGESKSLNITVDVYSNRLFLSAHHPGNQKVRGRESKGYRACCDDAWSD
jgi:hypothetical protein